MIPELLKSSLAEFTSLISSDALARHEKEVPLQDWRDELGRLRIWAANIGAHQSGQSSLEYRLRDSSHIKNQTVLLLERLKELVAELIAIPEEDTNDGAQEDELEGLDEYLAEIDNIDDIEDITEIQMIYKSLVRTITNLFQLSMVIRKPAQHDRMTGMDRLDAEPFKFWAKQHISHKYPLADETVVDRISGAMARQRAILKYRERHHAKLSQGIDPEKNSEDPETRELSETVVSTTFHDKETLFSDVTSDAGISETSYATTLLGGEGKMTIPSIPKEGINQTPFECPFCFFIITIRDTREWARHVFRDLMPYVCIFPSCPTPNKLYESRRQWFHHIREKHDLKPVTSNAYICLICKQDSSPEVIFERHVGRHLEESALFVLPHTTSGDEPELETDEDKGSHDNEGSGSVGETAPSQPIANHADDDRIPEHWERTASLGVMLDISEAEAEAESDSDSEILESTEQRPKLEVEPESPRLSSPDTGRKNMKVTEYFISGDGISREVIQGDICRYLGNEALVRPGSHNGRQGYFIRASRSLTSEMIADLKADSARWEADVSRRADLGYPRGSYGADMELPLHDRGI